ncbi:MAG: glycine/sarcosine/betaine reductase component B subunit, partial [Actinomycetota bacterium]|nr:glycine/sarcosine/betaine reductase component B subunit [Actinomycetota bacterium]
MGELRRIVHRVDQVALGEATRFEGGALTVSDAEARRILADPALADTRVTWVSPAQSARIVKVLDAVEPRTKGPGGAGIFPGFVSPPGGAGEGDTHVLAGAAVVAAGFLPRAQEAIIDMSGPAGPLSPLSQTHNLVVEFEPAVGASWEDVDIAVRRGVLALASRLAEAALDADPDEVATFSSPGARADGDDLPRVVAITNLQTQGTFKDVFVNGASFVGGAPTVIDANQIDDGAIVSGQFGHPSLKNPTYVHQNHPVAAALRARDGQDLRFAGVVISPEPVDQTSKERVAEATAELCVAAGFDAAIITKEGGGNADADVALKMDALESAGLIAVGLFAEMAGPDGTGPPIVVAPTNATAMVSTGNYDERLSLPEMEVALGGAQLDLLS